MIARALSSIIGIVGIKHEYGRHIRLVDSIVSFVNIDIGKVVKLFV